MTRFAAFITSQTASVGRLPVAHTTDAFSFREIMAARKLQPTDCPVYSDKVLYFFYGRPSYRVHYKTEPTSLRAFNPVCFVMDAGSVEPPDRILPLRLWCNGQRYFFAIYASAYEIKRLRVSRKHCGSG